MDPVYWHVLHLCNMVQPFLSNSLVLAYSDHIVHKFVASKSIYPQILKSSETSILGP